MRVGVDAEEGAQRRERERVERGGLQLQRVELALAAIDREEAARSRAEQRERATAARAMQTTVSSRPGASARSSERESSLQAL